MRKVDITGIHRIMTRYYGSRNMVVNTKVSEGNFINPYSINMIFDYDSKCELDYLLLNKRLNRYVIGAENLFVSIIKNENKISIFVSLYTIPKFKDYDFEFSQN